MESFSENDISSTSIENETLNTSSDQLVQLSQWMSQIVNRVEISRYSVETLNHLNSILGKLKNDKTYTKLDNQVVEALAGILAEQDTSNQTTDLKEVIFKLEKKVFIESIDFYQKTTSEPSSIMKIQMEVEDKGHTIWLTVFEASIPIPVQSDNQLFSPKLKASSGMSDTIKIFIRGDLTHLEGIEVKGSLFANDLLPKIAKPKDPLESYSMLPKQLYQLVGSDLFSDVVFEVEGKKVLAHKNILVARSEYFRAMLIEERGFVEAKQAKKNPLYPLYIGDIRHEIFMQVMNFVYTGHIDEKSFTHSIAVEVIRAADKLNLPELEKLCVFHVSNMINAGNVCKIYKEIHEKRPIVESLIQMCHDMIIEKFAFISQTDAFCSLPQELMITIIQNVIPRLNRVTSVQVNQVNDSSSIEVTPTEDIVNEEEDD